MHQQDIFAFLPLNVRNMITDTKLDYDKLQEIRLRYQKPLIFLVDNKELYFDVDGNRTYNIKNAYRITGQDIKEVLEFVSDYSIYAYEEEVRQGFLTIRGGHRVGLAGRVICENEPAAGRFIKGMKFITHINVRIAHEIKGCADLLLPWLFEKHQLCHTLLIGGPGCGKTTMLRDLIRQVSNGSSLNPSYTVGLVDERSEIAGCYQGVPQNDIGMRTDVLDCCPKADGMMLLIRSMSPDVIAVDELGCDADIRALETAINCGCKILATVHGMSLEEVNHKAAFEQLLKKQFFERYVVLHNKKRVGQVCAIYDKSGKCIFGESKC